MPDRTNPDRPVPAPAADRGSPPRRPPTTTALSQRDDARSNPNRRPADLPPDPTGPLPTPDGPFAARLALHRLADLVGGTPGRVVTVLLEEDFDRAATARRLGKTEHYVRTNIDRFVRAARRFAETDWYVRFLASIVIRD